MSEWILRSSATDNDWQSVTFGSDLFVAVSSSGTGNRVMTSPNGIYWKSRNSASNNGWTCVTYGTPNGNGLFVAVSADGSSNRVMTSSNGIIWTSRTTPNQYWKGVTYGNGLFVAVGEVGNSERVMTSPDGITWTARNASVQNNWQSVAYGNGLFVAAASSGTGNRIMTSPDGITWTTRTSLADKEWNSVSYSVDLSGNPLFIIVGDHGDNNKVMTSSDGINWSLHASSPTGGYWYSVTHGISDSKDLYVAVSTNGYNRSMTSLDGINWSDKVVPVYNVWKSITYGNGMFVAVALSGTGNRVMTLGTYTLPPNIDPIPEPPAENLKFDNFVYQLNDTGGLQIANSNYNTYVPQAFALSVFHQDKKTVGLFNKNQSLSNTETTLTFGSDYSGNITLFLPECASGNIIPNLNGPTVNLYIDGKRYSSVADTSNISYRVTSANRVDASGNYNAIIYDVDCGKYTVYSDGFEYNALEDNLILDINELNGTVTIPLTETNSTVIQTHAVSMSSYVTYVDPPEIDST